MYSHLRHLCGQSGLLVRADIFIVRKVNAGGVAPETPPGRGSPALAANRFEPNSAYAVPLSRRGGSPKNKVNCQIGKHLTAGSAGLAQIADFACTHRHFRCPFIPRPTLVTNAPTHWLPNYVRVCYLLLGWWYPALTAHYQKIVGKPRKKETYV